MELKELISVIRSLRFLRVPSDSIVMQILLQHLRMQMNDLSLGQIVLLEIVLENLAPTPLVEALRVALPVIAENHLDIEIQGIQFFRLVEWFCYACKHGFSSKNIRKISNALLDANTDLTSKDATNVLWGFVRAKNFVENDGLFVLATKTLINKIDEIPKHYLLQLIKRLQDKSILNENLLKAASKKAIAELWDTNTLHNLACIMKNSRYLDVNFLNFYAENLGNSISSNTLHLPIDEVFFVFSMSNVVPLNINVLVEWMSREQEQIKKIQSNIELLVKFALSLFSLEVSRPKICNLILGGKSLPYFSRPRCLGTTILTYSQQF